jgi:hypothetical protein
MFFQFKYQKVINGTLMIDDAVNRDEAFAKAKEHLGDNGRLTLEEPKVLDICGRLDTICDYFINNSAGKVSDWLEEIEEEIASISRIADKASALDYCRSRLLLECPDNEEDEDEDEDEAQTAVA